MANTSGDIGCSWGPLQEFINFLMSAFGSNAATTTPATTSLAPPMLHEPDFVIEKNAAGDKWLLLKPDYQLFDLSTVPNAPLLKVGEFDTAAEAQSAKSSLPRVRLPMRLQSRYDEQNGLVALPSAQQFDWRNDPDAQKMGTRLNSLLQMSSSALALSQSVSFRFVIARIVSGALATHTSDPNDPAQSAIILDPFAITSTQGLLQLASNIVHELRHARQYQTRTFEQSELAHVVSEDDFVLVEFCQEFEAGQDSRRFISDILASASEAFRAVTRDRLIAHTDRSDSLYFTEGITEMFADQFVREGIVMEYEEFARNKHAELLKGPSGNAGPVNVWLVGPEWSAMNATRGLWEEARNNVSHQ